MMTNTKTTIHNLKLRLFGDRHLRAIRWDHNTNTDDIIGFISMNSLSANVSIETDIKTGEKFNKLIVNDEPVAYGSYLLSTGCVLTPKQFNLLFEFDREI